MNFLAAWRRGQGASSLRFHPFLFVAGVLIAPLAEAAPAPASMTPMALTGWNRDLVVESNAVGPPFSGYATEMNAGEGNAFYQTGLPSYAWGLPPSGAFVSMVGDGTIFQFQPYTSSNALVLSPDTGLTNGTLTLATPAVYAQIAVIAHSGNGTNPVGSLTFTFADNSTLVTTYAAPDWFNHTSNVAWFGSGRIMLSNGNDTGGLENPRWYQTTVDLAALTGADNKPLVSLTFGKAGALSTAIYAVSGQLASTATPIAVTGFNRDLVVESAAAGPPYTNYATELDPGEGMAYYQHGLPGTSYGLPASGSFASAVDGSQWPGVGQRVDAAVADHLERRHQSRSPAVVRHRNGLFSGRGRGGGAAFLEQPFHHAVDRARNPALPVHDADADILESGQCAAWRGIPIAGEQRGRAKLCLSEFDQFD